MHDVQEERLGPPRALRRHGDFPAMVPAASPTAEWGSAMPTPFLIHMNRAEMTRAGYSGSWGPKVVPEPRLELG
jgi:hypothetical protein